MNCLNDYQPDQVSDPKNKQSESDPFQRNGSDCVLHSFKQLGHREHNAQQDGEAQSGKEKSDDKALKRHGKSRVNCLCSAFCG